MSRRMFSTQIVQSDAFLDMSVSARDLYFQLGMSADDDGFVNPRKIMKMIGASNDDLTALLGRRFVLPFESGVVVIKHWLIHNTIRQDRYKPTLYEEEKKKLKIKENRSYTDSGNQLATSGIPNDNQRLPQVKLSKGKLTSENKSSQIIEVREPSESERQPRDNRRVKDKEAVFLLFGGKQPWWFHKTQREAALRLFDRGIEKVKNGVSIMEENKDDQFCPQARTPFEYEQKQPKLKAYIERKGL